MSVVQAALRPNAPGSGSAVGARLFSTSILPWLLLAAAGLFGFFWFGLSSLPAAWSRPEYSHGYLIPPIALYLFLTMLLQREPRRVLEPAKPLGGVAVVLAGLVLGLAGNLVHIPDISTYGFLVCIAGFVLTAMGFREGLRFCIPIIYLGFMFPLPNVVYWPLSIRLQGISSELGVFVIQLFNVPVLLDGNVIDLGIYKLQVAEACSGLRYLFPLMSFGFLFGILYRGPFWHKAILFLSTIPITVLMNGFRIGVIGVLVDSYGIEQAEGFLHFFEGWIIFIACIGALYCLAAILQRTLRDPRPVHKMLETDIVAAFGQLRSLWAIKPTAALIFISILTSAVAGAWHLMPERAAAAVQREPLVLFDQNFNGWHGTPEVLGRDIEQVLAADDYLMSAYTPADGGVPVQLFVAFYRSQTEGSGIHSPEVCIPAGGWEVSRWTSVNSGVSTPSGLPLQVNRAIIQKGFEQQLVYYWFAQRGRPYTSAYAAKASTIYDSIARGRTDGALIRVLTPIASGERVEAADARLRGFLGSALPRLTRHIPE